jgi:hypothetical protein
MLKVIIDTVQPTIQGEFKRNLSLAEFHAFDIKSPFSAWVPVLGRAPERIPADMSQLLKCGSHAELGSKLNSNGRARAKEISRCALGYLQLLHTGEGLNCQGPDKCFLVSAQLTPQIP